MALNRKWTLAGTAMFGWVAIAALSSQDSVAQPIKPSWAAVGATAPATSQNFSHSWFAGGGRVVLCVGYGGSQVTTPAVRCSSAVALPQ